MRFASIIPAALALFLSAPAYAQTWGEFTDRQDHFTVNFPGDPKVEPITYKTEKGTPLPAKLYTAKDARGGEYSITVVNYASAAAEAGTAIAQAAKAIRGKGDVRYDGMEHTNNMKSQRVSVVLPGSGRFLLSETLMDHDRLFILQADTPPKMPPPAQFQASLQVLDDAGVAIRYKNPDTTERAR
jgi:hypothetical protein